LNRHALAPDQHIRSELGSLLPELRAFARFTVRDRSAADDLVQETVLRALSAHAQFEVGTNLKAWLFTILRRVHFEQVRRRRTETRVLTEQGPPGDIQPPQQEGQSALTELSRALWRLTPLLREALVLVGAQGLSCEEAAVICGVPAGTMRARVARARGILAGELGRQGQGALPPGPPLRAEP